MRAKVQKNSSHRFGHKERNRNLHARNPDPSARSLLCLNDKGIQKFKNPGALESHKILNLAVDPSFWTNPVGFQKLFKPIWRCPKKAVPMYSDVFPIFLSISYIKSSSSHFRPLRLDGDRSGASTGHDVHTFICRLWSLFSYLAGADMGTE